MSLLVPKTFASVRGAALDVTGPVASALHEVTATAAGSRYRRRTIIGTPHAKMPELKRQPARNASANGRSQSDLRGKSAAQGRVAITRTCPRTQSQPVGSSVPHSTVRADLRSSRSERRRANPPKACRFDLPTVSSGKSSDVGALSSRVLLVSDRASIVPARLLRNGIPVIAQGLGDGTVEVRPLEVGRNPFKIAGFHHQFGDRRPLSAARSYGPGRQIKGRWGRRSSTSRPRDHQLCNRRAAL